MVSARWLLSLVRSPHVLELLASYGFGFALYSTISIGVHGTSFAGWVCLTALGSTLYTFMEYIFHRVFLHIGPMNKIHDNHHNYPQRMKILATPIMPVHIYDFAVVVLLTLLLGRQTACGINCGIAIGQILMDTSHILFHFNYTPRLLRWGRNYHAFHHFGEPSSVPVDEDGHAQQGYGLTTPFWDVVFGTFPSNWPLYKRHPFTCILLCLLPFPLLSFILLSLFFPPSPTPSQTSPSTSTSRPSTTTSMHGGKSVSLITDANGESQFGRLLVQNVFISCVGALSTFFVVF